MLKNSKVVLFPSPEDVGQTGNFWTLLRICVCVCVFKTLLLKTFPRMNTSYVTKSCLFL
jgi:hypothetical protein